jgi:hypothetical protein
MNRIGRFLVACVLQFAGWGAAFAQTADVGLVNQVMGEVTYTTSGSGGGKAQAYMKMRAGDRFTLPAGTQLKVIYFQNGRMETWRGPSSFTAGTASSSPVSGTVFQVASLPVAVPRSIAKVPDMVQMSKLGGIQVRGTRKYFASLDRDEQAQVATAWETYHKLRQQLPPDDITAEQYLLPVLQGFVLYDDVKVVLDTLLRKQPGNQEGQELAEWVKGRIKQAN